MVGGRPAGSSPTPVSEAPESTASWQGRPRRRVLGTASAAIRVELLGPWRSEVIRPAGKSPGTARNPAADRDRRGLRWRRSAVGETRGRLARAPFSTSRERVVPKGMPGDVGPAPRVSLLTSQTRVSVRSRRSRRFGACDAPRGTREGRSGGERARPAPSSTHESRPPSPCAPPEPRETFGAFHATPAGAGWFAVLGRGPHPRATAMIRTDGDAAMSRSDLTRPADVSHGAARGRSACTRTAWLHGDRKSRRVRCPTVEPVSPASGSVLVK